MVLLGTSSRGGTAPGGRGTHLPPDPDLTQDQAYAYGAFALVRREAYEDVGPLENGNFLAGGDVDWGRRLLGRGWTSYYVAEAQVIHRQGTARSKRPIRTHLDWLAAHRRLLYTHEGLSSGLRCDLLFGIHLALLGGAAIASIVTREPPSACPTRRYAEGHTVTAVRPRDAAATSGRRRISVVIPTRNRQDILWRCLDALEAQTLSTSSFEVLVVDDGSDDETEARIRERGHSPRLALRLLHQDRRGPASARNLAIARARGDLLLFVNDDVIPHPHPARPSTTDGTVNAPISGTPCWGSS